MQVLEDSFSITVKSPQPGSAYTWSANNGQSGSGLHFMVPRTVTEVEVFRDDAPATTIPIAIEEECQLEIGGFSYINANACESCVYTFTPFNNNVVSHLWDFGDGSPTSTEVMPTHTYLASGTYTVSHTVVYWDGSGLAMTTCSETITVICGNSSVVSERVECCRLYLRLCGSGGAGCSHLWEILNASGQVALSSTEISPEFLLFNINTYMNGAITIRHTTVCNGVTSVETIPYTIQNEGIFVGDPNLPVTSISLYTNVGLASVLNNNQPLFPSLTIEDRSIFIQNILGIDATPVTFNRDEVCFANDAGVDIIKGKTFNLKRQNHLFDGCTTAWRGIDVYGRLDANGNPPSGGAGEENVIEGAVFAVHAEGSSSVTLVRTNFNQNFIGLFADNNFTSYIQNCQFTGGTLLPLGVTDISPVVAETGGYSQSGAFAGIYVTDATFNNTRPNVFSNLANGYYLLNTVSTLTQDDFGNCNANAAYIPGHTGHGMYFRHDNGTGRLTANRNYFGSSTTAIRAVSASPGTRVTIGGFSGVSNNTGNVQEGFMLEQRTGGQFQQAIVSYNNQVPPDPLGNSYAIDCRRIGVGFRCDPGASLVSNVNIHNNNIGIKTPGGIGVLLEGPNTGTGNVVVEQNDVSLHHTGGLAGMHLLNFRGARVDGANVVRIKYWADVYGILLENAALNTIDNNDIFGFQQAYPASRGIQLDNSPANAVTNNHIHDCAAAMFLFGDCSAQNQIRCNHFHDSQYGIHYTDMARTGEQIETGNRWESAGYNAGGGLTGARHDSPIKSFVQLSTYRTLQGASIQYPRTFELQPGINPSDWFVPGADAPCSSAPSPVVSDGETQAAGTGFAFGNGYDDGYNWVSRRLLYRKLRENPALATSNATVDSFYQQAAVNNIGAFDQVDESLMSAALITAGLEQQLSVYLSDADTAAAEMEAIAEEIWTGNPDETGLQALLNDFETAAAGYATASALIDSLLAPWKAGLEGAIGSALADNDALSCTETWETREKALNDLWLGKVRDGQWLTGADLDYIRETAEMCPWEGGFGVYKARALWQRISDEPLAEPDCGTGVRLTSEDAPNATAENLRLYPNPAQDQAMLEVPQAWTRDGALRYQLLTATGAVALEGRISTGATAAAIPLAGLPEGLYVCRVLREDAAVHTVKLMINKP